MEVWGDTVCVRQLLVSVAVSVLVSVSIFYLVQDVLQSHVETLRLAKAYAMFSALCGTLFAGVICALMFPPKRVTIEYLQVHLTQSQLADNLAHDHRGIGKMDTLPPETIAEIKTSSLYEMFLALEKTEQHTGSPLASSENAVAESADLGMKSEGGK